MGGVAHGPGPGLCRPPRSFPAQSRSGTNSVRRLWKGGSTHAGWAVGATAGAKFVLMLPEGCVWQRRHFWSEPGGEGRGKVLHLKNIFRYRQGCGLNAEGSGSLGFKRDRLSSDPGQVHLSHCKRINSLSSEGNGLAALAQGTGHKGGRPLSGRHQRI